MTCKVGLSQIALPLIDVILTFSHILKDFKVMMLCMHSSNFGKTFFQMILQYAEAGANQPEDPGVSVRVLNDEAIHEEHAQQHHHASSVGNHNVACQSDQKR